MAGAIFPLAALTCYGLVALQRRVTSAKRPAFILALIIIVAFEYYQPVNELTFSPERFDFIDWLKAEEERHEIRLVHLPIGRGPSKIYNLYQSLSDFPHAEGAISRTPDSAYAYIRANHLLNAWRQERPLSCEWTDRTEFLASLAQLEQDGFSHVVYHHRLLYRSRLEDSFREVEPAYADEFVNIYRLSDIRESCSEEQSADYAFSSAYAAALRQSPSLAELRGTALIFTPGVRTANHFQRYLSYSQQINRTIVTIASDANASLEARRIEPSGPVSVSELAQHAALWLVNNPLAFDAERTPAYQHWFAQRFHFCRRFQEHERAAFDLYLRIDIPCSAMDESSAQDIQYDSGIRLHNASYDSSEGSFRFYLAWTNSTWDKYAYSLQFFDQNGQKALQSDRVIRRQLLSVHEIDASSLPAGLYSIQLIVYDFETQVSQGGTINETGQRFAREVELAKVEIGP